MAAHRYFRVHPHTQVSATTPLKTVPLKFRDVAFVGSAALELELARQPIPASNHERGVVYGEIFYRDVWIPFP